MTLRGQEGHVGRPDRRARGWFSVAGDAVLDRGCSGSREAIGARVCFVPTASGEAVAYADAFRTAFGRLECAPRVLPLFARDRDAAALCMRVLAQDVLYGAAGARRISSPCGGRAAWAS
ncbi:Type 1 glutamine amidotransferase-like domain-containing protein [Streptomyces sp. DT18]